MTTPKLRTPLKPGWKRCERCLTRYVHHHGERCCINACNRRRHQVSGVVENDPAWIAAHEARISAYAALAILGRPLFQGGVSDGE